MTDVPNIPIRSPTRVPGFDYSEPGCYFVTICTHQRQHLFGRVIDGVMHLNKLGEIAVACWADLPNHYQPTILDRFVVMPNHLHGIITIDIPDIYDPLTFVDERPPLTEIVRGFKTFSSRSINAARGVRGEPVWQRSFHDHIIRSQRTFGTIRNYAERNPELWDKDTYFS